MRYLNGCVIVLMLVGFTARLVEGADEDDRVPNELIHETSPYLRQHAYNPVHWLPWGEKAFAEARRRDVPILVSIGYSSCHWCHVMAHESFENPVTAAIMNELFVCVKVDREEHPEVDEIYLDAARALTGQAGWPLHAFLDHDGRAFYALTYLPRDQWQELLKQIGGLWRSDRPRIAAAAKQVAERIAQSALPPQAVPEDIWQRLEQQCTATYDAANPGYGAAPKFPPSPLLSLLLALGEPKLLTQAEAILTAMQDGGIHDRVGGGFHRYSTDAAWRVPHFEKMLYDNAQLIITYARAARAFGRADFLRTAVAAGDYLLRDMRVVDAQGRFQGYASAEDADDPVGEGAFYAWAPAQLVDALGAEAGARLAREWDLSDGRGDAGTDGHGGPVAERIPHPRGAGVADGDAGVAARARWEAILPQLRAIRAARPRPSRDDKVLTDLNGLALAAFAALSRAAEAADRPRFTQAARELAEILIARHEHDGLVRMPGRSAYITDYAESVRGLCEAFEALGDPRLIDAAERIAAEAVDRLRADDGGFYTTPRGRDDLVRRTRAMEDNAYPAGQNALALGLVRLWNITGTDRWRTVADGIVRSGASLASRAPTALPTLLEAWLAARRGPLTAVITGPADDPRVIALVDACRGSTIAELAIVPAQACHDERWACLADRVDLREPQALICLGTVCLAPAPTPDEARARLAEVEHRMSR